MPYDDLLQVSVSTFARVRGVLATKGMCCSGIVFFDESCRCYCRGCLLLYAINYA